MINQPRRTKETTVRFRTSIEIEVEVSATISPPHGRLSDEPEQRHPEIEDLSVLPLVAGNDACWMELIVDLDNGTDDIREQAIAEWEREREPREE